MGHFFCFGKKDFCDSEFCSLNCKFCDGSGGLEWNQLEIVFESIFGEGYDLSRLRDLVQADRDGRCVVLPVKIGDSIYFTFLRKIIEKQVFSVVTFCNSQRIYCNGTSEFFRPDDIGKTVFLTREDAEEALKGEKIK